MHFRYCDFLRQHTGTVRRNLTLDEIRAEADAVRANGQEVVFKSSRTGTTEFRATMV